MNTTTTTAAPVVVAESTTLDLVAIEQLAMDRLNKSAGKTDLDDLLRGARRSLVLADCSGSMSDAIYSTGERKIDALRKVLQTLQAEAPVPVAAFGGYGQVAVVDTAPEPTGGTPMAEAIDFGKAQGATHLLLITDGEPNHAGFTLDAARRFGCPIDTFYVGDAGGYGATFAQELATVTGGTFSTCDLTETKKLAGQMRLLLGDGGAL